MTAYRAGFWQARKGQEFFSKYSIGSPLWHAAKAGFAFGQTGEIESWCYSKDKLIELAVKFMAEHGGSYIGNRIKDPKMKSALLAGWAELNEVKPWERKRK